MALFRSKMGDVRPLKFEKRVPSGKPRTVKKPEPIVKKSTGFVAHDSGHTSSCIRFPEKRAYKTMDEATSAAEFVMLERLKTVRPYQCHFCGQFHLTSRPSRSRS